MSDEEYLRACRETEEIYRDRRILLGLSQLMATRLGWWRACSMSVCRRKSACFARKREDDWSMGSGPMMPRCCDSFDKIETVKNMVWDFNQSLPNRAAEPAAKPARSKQRFRNSRSGAYLEMDVSTIR
jgi:hypothetical protein